jgi:hypothetical protein
MKAFRQLKSAEELEALDSEYDELADAMYEDSTKTDVIELNVSLSNLQKDNCFRVIWVRCIRFAFLVTDA